MPDAAPDRELPELVRAALVGTVGAPPPSGTGLDALLPDAPAEVTLLRRAGELLQRSGSAQEDLPVRLAMAVRELEVSQARRAFGGIDPAVFQRVRELATLADDREALRMADWYEWSILATGNRLEEARARGTAIADELVRDPRIAVQGEAFQMRTVMHWSNGEIDQAVAFLGGQRRSPGGD